MATSLVSPIIPYVVLFLYKLYSFRFPFLMNGAAYDTFHSKYSKTKRNKGTITFPFTPIL